MAKAQGISVRAERIKEREQAQPADLFDDLNPRLTTEQLRGQLLKWIGNKQRSAVEILSYFPSNFGAYREPFLGSGGVLGTLAPRRGVGSDTFKPLVDIWQALHRSPDELLLWYTERWNRIAAVGKQRAYEEALSSYNAGPNGKDLVYLCRAAYGGVVRFRKADGCMSTPCGIHDPISPDKFGSRIVTWHARTQGSEFRHCDYTEAMADAKRGDLVYCDPPYTHSQAILYGAQAFSLEQLFEVIAECKSRGVYVVLSIDGSKKSGDVQCALPIPKGLFEREVFIHLGRSMLRRFQMTGQTLEAEHVHDRLLLTY